MNIKILDLKELNRDVFTIECLWLASMVKNEPFSRIADDQATQYALLLCNEAPKLINSLLSLNQHCSLTDYPSIAGLVASKTPSVAKFTGIMPDYDADVIAYQRLKLKRGVLSFCLRDRELKQVEEVRSLLEDFENAYREFEQSLMISILSKSRQAKDIS